MWPIGTFVETRKGIIGKVVAHTGDDFVPLRVKFERQPGNWAKVLSWEAGRRVLDSAFPRNGANFYTLSVSMDSVVPCSAPPT